MTWYKLNESAWYTAAAVMYERAARCGAERSVGAAALRRRCLAAALTCLRLARPEHAFLARPAAEAKDMQVQRLAHQTLCYKVTFVQDK